jgi:hypothetical protein
MDVRKPTKLLFSVARQVIRRNDSGASDVVECPLYSGAFPGSGTHKVTAGLESLFCNQEGRAWPTLSLNHFDRARFTQKTPLSSDYCVSEVMNESA